MLNGNLPGNACESPFEGIVDYIQASLDSELDYGEHYLEDVVGSKANVSQNVHNRHFAKFACLALKSILFRGRSLVGFKRVLEPQPAIKRIGINNL